MTIGVRAPPNVRNPEQANFGFIFRKFNPSNRKLPN